MNKQLRIFLFLLLATVPGHADDSVTVYWFDNDSRPCPVLTTTPSKVTFGISGGGGVQEDYSFHVERIRRLDSIPVFLAPQGGLPTVAFTTTMDDTSDWLIRVAQYGAAPAGTNIRPLIRKRQWTCGEDTSLILSAGVLFTQLQNRTYKTVRIPSPPDTNVLSLQGGNSAYTPLGTALFNFKIPNRVFPYWSGLSVSTGPVFKFGGSPEVSSFGYFAGISANIWHGLYITPGFHLGEFADYPSGFTNGQTIPPNFGTLEPNKRWSWRFGFAITHRVKSFEAKKSTAAAAPAQGAPSGSGAGSQPGSQGSGAPPVSPATPAPKPEE